MEFLDSRGAESWKCENVSSPLLTTESVIGNAMHKSWYLRIGCVSAVVAPVLVCAGVVQLLAEGPDETGRIVQHRGAGPTFLVLVLLGILCGIAAVRLLIMGLRR